MPTRAPHPPTAPDGADPRAIQTLYRISTLIGKTENPKVALRHILEDLVRRFSRPTVTKGGIDAVLETYHRAGQRSVVDWIVAQINRAHGVDDVDTHAQSDGSGGQ